MDPPSNGQRTTVEQSSGGEHSEDVYGSHLLENSHSRWIRKDFSNSRSFPQWLLSHTISRPSS
jgi:hypothetical protein